jgi:SAM-dependent methyltransferase
VKDFMETSKSVPGQGDALLNLGCGADSHPAFVNIDLIARPGVIGHDLRQGVPFPDATFDLVYHSTMLSTMRAADALTFMRECRRVLKPGGVLRVVTEDLEQMCRVYLQKLAAACDGDRQSAEDYEWMMLELYDQATREFPGGEMGPYLRRNPLPNEAFIYSRIGEPGRRMVAGGRSRAAAAHPSPSAGSVLQRLQARIRKLVLTGMLGAGGQQALAVGRFRLTSGEVSYRMYDRYSLAQLFLNCGLPDTSVATPTASGYAGWKQVNLDVSPEGQPARPHALIMEGIRAA